MRARCGDGALSKDMEGMFTTLRDGVVAPEITDTKPRVKKPKVSVLKKIKSDVKAGKRKPKTVSKPRIRSLEVDYVTVFCSKIK